MVAVKMTNWPVDELVREIFVFLHPDQHMDQLKTSADCFKFANVHTTATEMRAGWG